MSPLLVVALGLYAAPVPLSSVLLTPAGPPRAPLRILMVHDNFAPNVEGA